MQKNSTSIPWDFFRSPHATIFIYLFIIGATPLKILKLWKDLFLCIIKIFLSRMMYAHVNAKFTTYFNCFTHLLPICHSCSTIIMIIPTYPMNTVIVYLSLANNFAKLE